MTDSDKSSTKSTAPKNVSGAQHNASSSSGPCPPPGDGEQREDTGLRVPQPIYDKKYIAGQRYIPSGRGLIWKAEEAGIRGLQVTILDAASSGVTIPPSAVDVQTPPGKNGTGPIGESGPYETRADDVRGVQQTSAVQTETDAEGPRRSAPGQTAAVTQEQIDPAAGADPKHLSTLAQDVPKPGLQVAVSDQNTVSAHARTENLLRETAADTVPPHSGAHRTETEAEYSSSPAVSKNMAATVETAEQRASSAALQGPRADDVAACRTDEPAAVPDRDLAPEELSSPGKELTNSSTPDTGAATNASADQNEPAKTPSSPLRDEDVVAQTAAKWKFKAVHPLEPEPVASNMRRAEQYQGSRVLGASVRGKKHKHEGTSRDDWFETAEVGDITIVVVADGAGSRRFSRIGAKTACAEAVRYTQAELARLGQSDRQQQAILGGLSMPTDSAEFQNSAGYLSRIVQNAVVSAAGAVKRACEERASDDRYRVRGRTLQVGDLACTLLVLLALPTENGECLTISCQIGDGAIASIDSRGTVSKARVLSEPDSGEYSGQTEFITSDQFSQLPVLQSRTRLARGRGDLIMLMTDGVSDDYFPNETRLVELYYDLIANGIIREGTDTVNGDTDADAVAIPEPLFYPWVDNQDVMIGLQYTSRICDRNDMELGDLWTRRGALAQAGADVAARIGCSDDQLLEIWLDNYVQRGSFDDRTLVLVQMGGRDR